MIQPASFLRAAAALLSSALLSLAAAPGLRVVATHALDVAREGEVISVSWPEIAKALPGAAPDSLIVRDASGVSLVYQFTNPRPDERKGGYDAIHFQHDFAAGEKSASFTIEKAAKPVPPFPSRVFARYVPDRLDDFAFENDRIAHRIYGPALASDAAGGSKLTTSGIDVWAKRVRYPIVDRWYLRGHDNYHKDNGEGMDTFAVNQSRGCGGLGLWDGSKLLVSANYATWRVIANGPIRAVFELSYAPWDIGGGANASEVKRFTVDAGRNFHLVESRFTVSGGKPELLVALGLTKASDKGSVESTTKDQAANWMSRWSVRKANGNIGTAVIAPTGITGFAEDNLNELALVKARAGEPLRYYIGACWSLSPDFPTRESWEAYTAAFAKRLSNPVVVSLSTSQ
jgi:hypothetical protein